MKPAARQSGNLMIDLIVGILLLAIISISAGGVLSNLFQRSADAYERVQSTWLANSVMEYYSGKEFADIKAANISNDEKFTPYSGLVADVTVNYVTIDGDNIVASAEETSFKKIIVTANNNVSDNSVTLKTIINDGGEQNDDGGMSLSAPDSTQTYGSGYAGGNGAKKIGSFLLTQGVQ